MKEQSSLIRKFSKITLVTFILMIILEFKLDKYIFGSTVGFLIGKRQFVINILISALISSLTTLLVSITTYNQLKTKTLVDFFLETEKYSRVFDDYNRKDNVSQKLENLQKFINYDISELNKLYGEISFIYDIKNNVIDNDMYFYILDIRKEIGDIINKINIEINSIEMNSIEMNSKNIDLPENLPKDSPEIKRLFRQAEEIFINIKYNDKGIVVYEAMPTNLVNKNLKKTFDKDLYRIIYGKKAYKKYLKNKDDNSVELSEEQIKIRKLKQSIYRETDRNIEVPIEIVEEYNELTKKIRNKKKHT